MENMIEKIVEADDQAKAMEKKTLQEKEELNKEVEQQATQIYQEYMDNAKITAKKNSKQEEINAHKQLVEIQNKHKSVLIKLQADYKNNFDKWVDQIVQRTITE